MELSQIKDYLLIYFFFQQINIILVTKNDEPNEDHEDHETNSEHVKLRAILVSNRGY